MDLGWRERGVCKARNDAGDTGERRRDEGEKHDDMGGNTDLGHKKVTTEGGREVESK